MPATPEITLRIFTAEEGSALTFTLEQVEPGHPTLNADGTFVSQFPVEFSAELRWYMERFLDERDDAALVRAKRIRESIKVCGKRLFQDIFQPNPVPHQNSIGLYFQEFPASICRANESPLNR